MRCHGYTNMCERSFWTKDEKIEQLQEYKDWLDKESKGVEETINKLKEAS